MKYLIESCTLYYVDGHHEKLLLQDEVVVTDINAYKRSITALIHGIDHILLSYSELS